MNSSHQKSDSDYETPVGPFGDASDFDFSPDGSLVAFTSRPPGESREAAWSTNTNIYTVSLTSDEEPVCLTKDNQGYDTLPSFSPDGKYLAWTRMSTPGYEADMNRVMVYDLLTRELQTLTPDWDRSASSIAWAVDSTSIFVTAHDLGSVSVFNVDLAGKTVERLIKDGSNSGLCQTTLPDGKKVLVFRRSSPAHPHQLSMMEHATGSVVALTKFNENVVSKFELVVPESLWFTGAEGDQVQAWYFKPAGNFDASRSCPLALLVYECILLIHQARWPRVKLELCVFFPMESAGVVRIWVCRTGRKFSRFHWIWKRLYPFHFEELGR